MVSPRTTYRVKFSDGSRGILTSPAVPGDSVAFGPGITFTVEKAFRPLFNRKERRSHDKMGWEAWDRGRPGA